jgi:hypothetical protein
MALDTGIHAGMTTFWGQLNLCITMSAERGNDKSEQIKKIYVSLLIEIITASAIMKD